MGGYRRHMVFGRKDATSRALIAEAKRHGADYLPIDGIIDGVLFHQARTFLVDWKSPKAKRTERQMKLILAGWPIHFVESSEQLRTLLFGERAA